MVGTLIEVGRGERSPESIPALFGGKREQAGFLAPAQGLCLMEVTY
jgi:tRNA pseudouridine38-40 synthase